MPTSSNAATKPIIKVENLAKQYRIAASKVAYETFRDSLTGILRAPLRRLRGERRPAEETFWALQDVSFQVKQGEVIGIIGGRIGACGSVGGS